MISIENVTSKIVYGMLIHKIKEKSSSEVTIQNKLNNSPIDWPSVYHLAWNTTIDSYSRAFQFKCLHNILFLNERLFKLHHVDSPLCSFCKAVPETIIHLFADCQVSKTLWRLLQSVFPEVGLPDLTPESAFLGLGQSYDNLSNHIHLIFRIALYNSRQKEVCSINYLKRKIIASKKLESNMTFFDNDKRTKNFQKWRRCPDSIL